LHSDNNFDRFPGRLSRSRGRLPCSDQPKCPSALPMHRISIGRQRPQWSGSQSRVQRTRQSFRSRTFRTRKAAAKRCGPETPPDVIGRAWLAPFSVSIESKRASSYRFDAFSLRRSGLHFAQKSSSGRRRRSRTNRQSSTAIQQVRPNSERRVPESAWPREPYLWARPSFLQRSF